MGLTGRCYCGAVRLSLDQAPQVVSYCHCIDCRRLTGAPFGVFAGFAVDALRAEPELGAPVSHVESVQRWFCRACGSPLAATFGYLPGQVYVPVGVLDQAAELKPELHCHFEARLPWVQIGDDLPRIAGSGRDALDGRND